MPDGICGRQWRLYLDDMLEFWDRVSVFTAGIDRDQFMKDRMRFDATVRNLELIGEAATHIPEHVRLASPEIPWRMVVAARNRLIHGYLGIDVDMLWSLVETEVPLLKRNIKKLRDISPL